MIERINNFYILKFFNTNRRLHCLQILKIFLLIIFLGSKYDKISLRYKLKLNEIYFKLQLDLNFTFKNEIKNKIRIGIYYNSIKNGGIERLSALLLNYLDEVKIFKTYLFTHQQKEDNEYKIPTNTERIIINTEKKNHLIKMVDRHKIDILIYHFYNEKEIQSLNRLKNTKIILYNHSCFLIWIYSQLYFFYKTIYNIYKNSKYVISLVPFENDYLFKKWGINSILMTNFMTFNYNNVIPSDLSSQTILMIGRASDRMKRFELGVEAMKHIIKEIPQSEMKIISNLNCVDYLEQLIKLLNLEDKIDLVGYYSNPEIYFKNASLHIFPSISESFGLVLSETKIFGIPNILVGLDYVSIVKGGTIIIYDDNSKSIAKEAIKILKFYKYRKKLGKEARKSMKKFRNDLLLKKWIKLILSIYNGNYYYEKLKSQDNKITEEEAINILKNQVELLKMRMPRFKNITIKNLENFEFMKGIS